MISVAEALALVKQQVIDFGTEQVGLLSANGRVLAQDILADRSYPPFDRVTMDGIAILHAAFSSGVRSFIIENIQAAGQAQQTLNGFNGCLEVMTGAMLPEGCDAVIPYEQCSIAGGTALVEVHDVKPLQNIHLKGTDSKEGDVLLTAGGHITPAMIGLIASAGLSTVTVKKLPDIAVCATGDELVEIEEQPLPHQIRQSNSYMLLAELQKEGIEAQRFHLHDEPEEISRQLKLISARYRVVLLSGAVSKGKFDHLPAVLAELGFETIFHGIAQRPGKPFLFGKLPGGTLIFGFPGNPISTFVCYHLYFKRWLDASLGIEKKTQYACLSRSFVFKPNLAYHALVTLHNQDGKLIATPVDSSTSGDLVSLAKTEAILSLPAEQQDFNTGEAFSLLLV